MAQSLTHDVLILGAGLAGLRAAVEISQRFDGRVDIGIVSKVQLMRAHSVCAEGGTAAVLKTDEGDSLELHAWDSVKGSDFLADQDVVWRFVKAMPREIRLLDHWGIPWTREASVARGNEWPPTRPASSKCRRSTISCCATSASSATTRCSSPTSWSKAGASPGCWASTHRLARRSS
jgi:succinate dehydrogenase/fumarate reductase flavoprotein subunit